MTNCNQCALTIETALRHVVRFNPMSSSFGANQRANYFSRRFYSFNRNASSPNFLRPVPIGTVLDVLRGNSNYFYGHIQNLILECINFRGLNLRDEIVLCISSLLFHFIRGYLNSEVSHSDIDVQNSFAFLTLSVPRLQEVYNHINQNATPQSEAAIMMLQNYQRTISSQQEGPFSRIVLSLFTSTNHPIVMITRYGIHAPMRFQPYRRIFALPAGNVGAVANISSRRNSSSGLTVERIEKFEHFQADESLAGEQCCICLNDIEVGKSMVRLDCKGKHILCEADTNKWFADHKTCPLCRHDFN